MVDTPDHALDEEGLKEKRRQRLMKAGYDARERAKAERAAEKLRQVRLAFLCVYTLQPLGLKLPFPSFVGRGTEER